MTLRGCPRAPFSMARPVLMYMRSKAAIRFRRTRLSSVRRTAAWSVSSGLSPGDRVVVDGTGRLLDGAKVTVAAEEKPAEAQSAPPQENGACQPASAAPQAPPQGVAPSAGKPAKHLLKQK